MKKIRIFQKGIYLLSIAIFTLFSCSSDDDGIIVLDPQIEDPIYLDCEFFSENRTLTNNPNAPIDYIIDCGVQLRESTLTIEPGVVIAFTENGSLHVEGFYESAAIIAKGTAESPIVFKGTREEKGHWKGIRISNDNNINELDYTIIRDAGKEPWTAGASIGGISLGENGYGIGRVKLTNSQLINNQGYGLNCHISSGNVNYSMDYTFINNVITDNDFPVKASMYNLQFLHLSNDFNGNQTDEIHIVSGGNGTLTTTRDATWYNHGLPYIFSPGVVGLSSKITIEPGTVLKFPRSGSLVVDRTNYSGVGTGGGLIAKGTANEPIVFTAVEPYEKYWLGITINSPFPGNEIGHAIIEYTGLEDGDNTHNLTLDIGSEGDTYLNIHDVVFRNSNHSECAIWLQSSSIWKSQADINNITVDPNHCLLRDDNPLYW